MKESIIIFSLLVLTISQFPCSNQSLDAVEVQAYTDSYQIDLSYGYNNVQGRWYNPQQNQTKSIFIYGWDKRNATLTQVFFVADNSSDILPAPGPFQSSVLFHQLYDKNSTKQPFVFAFKSNYYGSLEIQLTAKRSAFNSSLGFLLQLYRGAYNFNGTCIEQCSGRIRFAQLNGTIDYEQFQCQSNEQESSIVQYLSNKFQEIISYFQFN